MESDRTENVAILVAIKPVDLQGRVVIPTDVRSVYGIQWGTYVEFLVDGDLIIVRPFQPHDACTLCGEIVTHGGVLYMGKLVCTECREDMVSKVSSLSADD